MRGGRDEQTNERRSSSSYAICLSFTIIIVSPNIDTELMGPVIRDQFRNQALSMNTYHRDSCDETTNPQRAHLEEEGPTSFRLLDMALVKEEVEVMLS